MGPRMTEVLDLLGVQFISPQKPGPLGECAADCGALAGREDTAGCAGRAQGAGPWAAPPRRVGRVEMAHGQLTASVSDLQRGATVFRPGLRAFLALAAQMESVRFVVGGWGSIPLQGFCGAVIMLNPSNDRKLDYRQARSSGVTAEVKASTRDTQGGSGAETIRPRFLSPAVGGSHPTTRRNVEQRANMIPSFVFSVRPAHQPPATLAPHRNAKSHRVGATPDRAMAGSKSSQGRCGPTPQRGYRSLTEGRNDGKAAYHLLEGAYALFA